MKIIQSKVSTTVPTKKFCIRYSPIDPQADRPSLDALWQALRTYDGIVIAKQPAAVETAFDMLKQATLTARASYPRIRLEVLEDGREMFTW